MMRILSSLLLLVGLSALVLYLMGIEPSTVFDGKDDPKTTFIATDSKHKPGRLAYNSVKPILETRCVSCHTGYDAPCQLDLASYEGLQRGASKQAIYGLRWQALTPTRLLVDGKTPDAWRNLGFFAVLNEKSQFPEINLNNSLVAKMLALKHDNPFPDTSTHPKGDEECPTLEEFNAFAQKHPFAGMPHILPGLNKTEHETLMNWLQDGAKNSPPADLSEAALAEISKWEQFLNDPAPAVQLTARYLYEHLYSGHLHFNGHPANEFYRLVRSKTAPGLPIQELASQHPYTAPDSSAFSYRLQAVTEALADKNHAVYELGDAKMARIKELFLKPTVTVAQVPPYPQQNAAQPFDTFKDLPVSARHQFLLDDAGYFFSAIFKSPALIQHTGLSGLHDQTWIAFLKPRTDLDAQNQQFLSENSPLLRLPAATGENAGFTEWFELKGLNKQYLEHKAEFTQAALLKGVTVDETLLWNGDGSNDNAYLTLFRHDDNASVVKGFQGHAPNTAWVIDYPLFERLHYLLLAGFNVYGDTAYQLSTRLTLDLLRSEAENNFLQFLPKAVRPIVHDSWYQGLDSQWLGVFAKPDFANQAESAISYSSQDYTRELFGKLPAIAAPIPTPAAPPENAQAPATIATPCPQEPCPAPTVATPEPPAPLPDYDNFAKQLAELKGPAIAALPEVSFLQISTAAHPEQKTVYTLIRNRQFRHVAVLFGENQRRQPERDTLSVLPGLVGSYPNQFFAITSDQMEGFITQLQQAQTEASIAQFFSAYGISRNHPQFWAYYDNFLQHYRNGKAVQVGVFDLGRYGRR
jgi:hypothetical protein